MNAHIHMKLFLGDMLIKDNLLLGIEVAWLSIYKRFVFRNGSVEFPEKVPIVPNAELQFGEPSRTQ